LPYRSLTSGRWIECCARSADTRFFTIPRTRTRNNRCLSTRLIARMSFDGAYAAGIRSARKRCANVSESILSVLMRASAMARTLPGCAKTTSSATSSSQSYTGPQLRLASTTAFSGRR